MTSLITIPGATALHYPTATSAPLPLSTGDLTLVLIPANPPTHPSDTVTLSVGASAFPLLPKSPVQRVKAKQEHPSYQFSPIPADGSAAVGFVRIQMKDSHSQGEWDAAEALCSKFESELRSRALWEDKVLYVNDEYDTSGTPVKGWGETVAASVMGGATMFAEKIASFTNQHLPEQRTANPIEPTPRVAGAAAAVRNQTAGLADKADIVATKVGQTIHDAGKKIGEQLPDNIAKRAQPVPEHEKGDLRKMAEETWKEATIAAKGIADSAITVGKSLSDNAHKAVEHNYGRQADQVAQDVGTAGSNVGSAGLAAFQSTSVVIQGANASSGVASTAPKAA